MNKYGSSAEVLGNFKEGFGKDRRDLHHDLNNAVYLAMELLNLELPYKFQRKGKLGVVSLELCSIIDVAENTEGNDENIQKIGIFLSEYNSRQLRNMALYLWNKKLLHPDKRGEAENLLKTMPKSAL